MTGITAVNNVLQSARGVRAGGNRAKFFFALMLVFAWSAQPAAAQPCMSDATCGVGQYCQDTGTLGDGMGDCAAVTATPLPNETCPVNLASCTSNDVMTTVLSSRVVNNDTCGDGFIDIEMTLEYESTASMRYDLGLFVSKDGGTLNDSPTALSCAGAAAQQSDGNVSAFLGDIDTDLFLDADPANGDTCGDLSSTAGPVRWTVSATVACIEDPDTGNLRVESCRVWEHNAGGQHQACTNAAEAGTGSKCDCVPLILTDVPLDACDNNPVCTGSNTSCGVASCDPLGAPDNCDVFTPFADGTVCQAAAGVCDEAEVCDGITGVCPADGANLTNECRTAENVCDVGEFCSDASNDCPTDEFATTAVQCGDALGECDQPEFCTGTDASCQPDGANLTNECRTAENVCDVGEFCSDASNDCPTDEFATTAVQCGDALGECDQPEFCTGTDASCQPDGANLTTQCADATGVCDLAEFCSDASNDCPVDGANSTSVCRAAVDVCDLDELCSNASDDCPDDGFADPGTSCGDDTTTNICTDPDECDGSGFCDPMNKPCGFVTDSALCTFDVSPKGVCVNDSEPFDRAGACDVNGLAGAPTCDGGYSCMDEQQFKLLFTPDGSNWPGHKLNASNPGQFYYNLVADISDQANCEGTTREFEITIPYPFITHGATPVHVYDGKMVGSADQCFMPIDVEDQFKLEITLDHWLDPALAGPDVDNLDLECDTLPAGLGGINKIGDNGMPNNCTFKFMATYPESCQLYINVHLDYALKGKDVDANPADGLPDRYINTLSPASPWGSHDALKNITLEPALDDCVDHAFSHVDPDIGPFGDIVQNLNIFKKPAGVFGLVLTSSNGNPVQGATVTLSHPSDGVIGYFVTDEDGGYGIEYKHKGKQTDFTVTFDDGNGNIITAQVPLKGNGYAEASFDVTTGTAEVVPAGNVKSGGGGKGGGKKSMSTTSGDGGGE